MRSTRHATYGLGWPSLRHAQGRLMGLPFVLIGCAPGLVFGVPASIAALMIASLANFLVYVPLMALTLNGGDALAEDSPMPPLTPRAYAALLLLWSATAWVGALLAQHLEG